MQDQQPITIAEYFGDGCLNRSDRVPFDRLSDGLINYTTLARYGSKEKETLLKCVRAVVHERFEFEFAGRITLAKIMGDAMQMLRDEHGLDAPKCWYPVIKALREQHKRDAIKFRKLIYSPQWRPQTAAHFLGGESA